MSAGQNQEFCVRWNSHLGSIGAAFPQLLAGQRFVDVTLACEGHQVHCHRLVLAACSSYFEAILAENPCKHPVIILPSEIKLWEIQALVDFMYKGEVNVTQAGLPQLLRCAEQLRIRGLHGSDAALNLDQLKELTHKAVAAAALAAVGNENTTETDSTNDTTTTTSRNTPITSAVITASMPATTTQHFTSIPSSVIMPNAVSQPSHQHANPQNSQQSTEAYIKREVNVYPPTQLKTQRQSNGQTNMYQQQEFKQESHTSRSNFSSADDDDDESVVTDSPAAAFNQSEVYVAHESTVDEDHSYVVSTHDDESFISNDHETMADNSGMQSSLMDSSSASFKRVRRSEASLAQAAKCVSKGETFQTVSNMFNIPVSTIRFFMARKGILPKRKRGRGAASNAMGASISSGTLADLKQQHLQHQHQIHKLGLQLTQSQQQQPQNQVQQMDEDQFHLMPGYKIGEQQVGII